LTQNSNYVPAQYQSHWIASAIIFFHLALAAYSTRPIGAELRLSRQLIHFTGNISLFGLPLLGPASMIEMTLPCEDLIWALKTRKLLTMPSRSLHQPVSLGLHLYSIRDCRDFRMCSRIFDLVGSAPIDLLIHILDPQIPENDWHHIHLYKTDGRLVEKINALRTTDVSQGYQ